VGQHTFLIDVPFIGSVPFTEDNVTVSGPVSMNGSDVYTLMFQDDLGGLPIQQVVPHVVPFTVAGGSDTSHPDTINAQSTRETSFLLGGAGADIMNLNVDANTGQPLAANGINAVVTLDGRGNPAGSGDIYNVHLVGGTTASLINVFDSGTGSLTNDGDKLPIYGPLNQPNVFLLRASAAASGLAFVGLLNKDPSKTAAQQPVERVNYDANLGSIVVNGGNMGDKWYVDDTRAPITINGG